MPGIVGLITDMPQARATRQLERMLAAVCHESFYRTGTWVDESLGVYAGWVEHGSSNLQVRPLSNERGEVVLVFSGQEYSEPGAFQETGKNGHGVEAGGGSYLVRQYEEDPGFPACLNGRFHGLVADRRRRTTTLFNDRYGMHRLCYHESADGFYFGAEAKAILAVRPELRSPDYKGLGEVVACGCVLGNRTVFQGINVLPQASAWVFRGAAIERKGSYFQPREWEEQKSLEPEAYYRELRDSLARSLPRYFNGNQRIGLALTGGLDTRVIMAWHKPAPDALPCYTFGGAYRDCQDVRVARHVARICGQPHEVIGIGEEFLSRFPHYAERSVHLTEGTLEVSRASDLYVSERAREIAPIKVVGTYGSEIIRNAVMFKPTPPMPGLYQAEFSPYIDEAGRYYAGFASEHPITFAAFRQFPWFHHGILSLEESQLTVRSPYLDNDFIRTAFLAPNPGAADTDVRWRLIRDGNPVLAGIPSDSGIRGESAGLSTTATRRFLELTLKAEYAYDYCMPQWMARIDRVFAGLHPERIFLGRHKFCHFRIWYRDSLASYVREILLDPRTLGRPYLEPRGVEAIVAGHLKGHRNYTREIHKLLTLELLHRRFFDAT